MAEPDIYETTLELLRKTPSGIAQSALWKQLGIDSRKCTRIVQKLLDEDKITREPISSNGSRTFLIRSADADILVLSVEPEHSDDVGEKYELLFNAKGEFEPCVSCTNECGPEGCIRISRWICAL